MTKQEFRNLCDNRILFMDGATGSILLKRGMPSGVCNEAWIADNPELLIEVQKEYASAGSDIILAPTFGANSFTLKAHGLENKISDINKRLFKISKEANPNLIIAGDISMTGMSIEPVGSASFEDLIDIYKEQIQALYEAGADILVIETIINLADARAACLAAREVCDLPVMITLSFNENGATLYGTSPEAAVIALQELDIDAIGVNCSAGPDKMAPIVERMAKFSKLPLIVKPNAGLPKTDDKGETIYDMIPEEFAKHFHKIMEYGVYFIGGCCGTSPDYIAELVKSFKDYKPIIPAYRNKEAMLSCQRYGIFISELDDNEKVEINVDDFTIEELKEEINDCQNDLLILKGNDLKKLSYSLRLYNGIAAYDGDYLTKDLADVLIEYGAVVLG